MTKKSASKKKVTQKRGPKPLKRKATILVLREMKRATSRELSCSTAFMFQMLQAGLVQRVGKAEKSGRGRPETVWALSKKGNGVASSLISTSRRNSAVAA